MADLKGLTLTTFPDKPNNAQRRRDKFVRQLEEQSLLFADPAYTTPVHRWKKIDGERQRVTSQRKVSPWWRTDAAGRIVMSVRHGQKAVEIDKGKTGIVVPNKEAFPTVVDTLIAAIRKGELDNALDQASRASPKPKRG